MDIIKTFNFKLNNAEFIVDFSNNSLIIRDFTSGLIIHERNFSEYSDSFLDVDTVKKCLETDITDNDCRALVNSIFMLVTSNSAMIDSDYVSGYGTLFGGDILINAHDGYITIDNDHDYDNEITKIDNIVFTNLNTVSSKYNTVNRVKLSFDIDFFGIYLNESILKIRIYDEVMHLDMRHAYNKLITIKRKLREYMKSKWKGNKEFIISENDGIISNFKMSIKNNLLCYNDVLYGIKANNISILLDMIMDLYRFNNDCYIFASGKSIEIISNNNRIRYIIENIGNVAHLYKSNINEYKMIKDGGIINGKLSVGKFMINNISHIKNHKY